MNGVILNSIAADILVDRLAMLLIVAQRIEDLGQGEMGQSSGDLFGGDAEFPQLGDRTYRGACPCDDGGTMENLLGTDNVRVACGSGHECSDRDLLFVE